MALTSPHVYAAQGWSTEVAHAIAAEAHAGALDKIGVAYIRHPEAVAELVKPFGPVAVQVALLHDVVEDTGWTLDMLAAAGAPQEVLSGVESVTKVPGESREVKVRRAGAHRVGRVVKAADNRHNGDPDRIAQVPDPAVQQRLRAQYARDRVILDEYGAPTFP